MQWLDLLFFLASLFVLVKSAGYAIDYSSKLARLLRVSEFIVSFFIISVISCFPEATVAIVSALNGIPQFGLGALLGSNVADLCLVFGIVALASSNGIKVKSDILRNDVFYLVLLLVPLVLGFDGHLSRADGVILVLSGVIFLANLSSQSKMFRKVFNDAHDRKWVKNFLLLSASMAFLIVSAYYTVEYGVRFANGIGIPPFLVALTVVSIGSCIPELIFSLRAVKTRHDELALGDVLGTVIIDATIIIGIISLIQPFSFNPNLIYVTGSLMFLAGTLAVIFIKTGKVLTKKEGMYLLLFYIASIIIEFIVNRVF